MQKAVTKHISDSANADIEDGEIRDSGDEGDADADYSDGNPTHCVDLQTGSSSSVNQACNKNDFHRKHKHTTSSTQVGRRSTDNAVT